MRARSPRICSEQQGGVGGVLLQHGAASGMTGAHLMTVDAPSTLPLRLADLSGSYNIQMTGTGGTGCEVLRLLAGERRDWGFTQTTQGLDNVRVGAVAMGSMGCCRWFGRCGWNKTRWGRRGPCVARQLHQPPFWRDLADVRRLLAVLKTAVFGLGRHRCGLSGIPAPSARDSC